MSRKHPEQLADRGQASAPSETRAGVCTESCAARGAPGPLALDRVRCDRGGMWEVRASGRRRTPNRLVCSYCHWNRIGWGSVCCRH